MLNFFATCPKGLESLLLQELNSFNALSVKETVAGVYFTGSLAVAYRACLWSRLANRVLLVLKTSPVRNAQELYQTVQKIAWLDHVKSTDTLLVDFAGTSDSITNTHFGAQKVKDAIVDQIRQKTGHRPSVAKHQPALRVNVYLQRELATISIDLAGESLHKRSYRLQAGQAPLKENLAAAILLRANWPQLAAKQAVLLDPLCGSGTLLIEAALLAADIAPGLLRPIFGLQTWLGHCRQTWQTLWEEAQARREQGLKQPLPEMVGFDKDENIVHSARLNIARAGLTDHVKAEVGGLADLKNNWQQHTNHGLVITNPPYGERLNTVAELQPFYAELGEKLKSEFINWQAAIFTANVELAKKMKMRPYKQYAFFNGAIPCKLLLFSVEPKWLI